MKQARYDLQIVKKPATDSRDRLIDAADLPALRRYQAVTRAMRVRGITEAEAVAQYDRPRGVCETCGAACLPTRRTCDECKLAQAREDARLYRERQLDLRDKLCEYQRCGKPFRGGHHRRMCDEHTFGKGKPRLKLTPTKREASAAPSKARPKPSRASRPVITPKALPSTWNRPLPDSKRKPPPAEPAAIIVPPGVRKFVAPPLPGLRDLFGVSGTVKTAAD